eukprot:402774-Hanusia_phi.AAC.1
MSRASMKGVPDTVGSDRESLTVVGQPYEPRKTSESRLSISIVTILTSRHARALPSCKIITETIGPLLLSPNYLPLICYFRMKATRLTVTEGHGWAAASRSAYTVPPAVSRSAAG